MKKIGFILVSAVLAVIMLAACDGNVNAALAGDSNTCTVTIDTYTYTEGYTWEQMVSEGDVGLYYDAEKTKPFSGTKLTWTINKGDVFNPTIMLVIGENDNLVTIKDFLELDDNPLILTDSSGKGYNGEPITSDVTFYPVGGFCLAAGSVVTMADGSKQPIETVERGDKLLTWDFYQGKLTSNTVIAYEKTGARENNVITITTDAGNKVSFVDVQSFFDTDKKVYFPISWINYKSAKGRNILVNSGSEVRSEKITEVKKEKIAVDVYDIVTASALNFFADNILTVYPGLLGTTPYAVDDNYKYDAEKMAQDRARYGLFTYDEFTQYGSKDAFDMFRIADVKVMIGKGLITSDYVKFAINRFFQSTQGVR